MSKDLNQVDQAWALNIITWQLAPHDISSAAIQHDLLSSSTFFT